MGLSESVFSLEQWVPYKSILKDLIIKIKMILILLLGVAINAAGLFLIFTRHLEDGMFVYIPKVNNDNQIFPVCL